MFPNPSDGLIALRKELIEKTSIDEGVQRLVHGIAEHLDKQITAYGNGDLSAVTDYSSALKALAPSLAAAIMAKTPATPGAPVSPAALVPSSKPASSVSASQDSSEEHKSE